MKKSVFILGTSLFSRQVFQAIVNEKAYCVKGFCLEKKYVNETVFCGLPVYAIEDLQDVVMINNLSKGYRIINTIGYSQMNKVRENLAKKYQEKIQFVSFISKYSYVDSSSVIGNGVVILPNVYVGPNCQIGKGTLIHIGSVVSHDITIGCFSFLSCCVTIGGDVQIGNNCFIGLNSTIRNGITIADKTFIGAACYIAHDTKENSVYVQKPTMCKEGITADEIIERV